MNSLNLRARFDSNLTVLDGGLATSLEDRGHDLSGSLWSARILRDQPEELVWVNVDHASAGAEIISTASYQVSRQGFIAVGLTAQDADDAIATSVSIARAAAQQVREQSGREVLVAGSFGPFGAVLADGSEYRGDYAISREALTEFHRERIGVMVSANPDLIAFETVPSALELEVLNELLTEEFADTPAWISCSSIEPGLIADGTPTVEAFARLNAPNIIAFGFNCIKPENAADLLHSIADVRPELPRIVYTNAGRTWDAVNRCWLDEGALTIDPSTLQAWVDAGARIIGGCCGLGRPHIEAVRAFIDAQR
jgi:homocysteine S-methyltransferase